MPLLGNAHIQTVLGAYLTLPALFRSQERHVPLEDGDHLAIHDSVPDNWQDGQPFVILVHGLAGSHRSGYMVRMTRHLLGRGWRVVRVDLRGCGRGLKLARRPYHAGCSADLRAVVALLQSECPRSPLFLLGFSLGGNIVLKLAAEARQHPLPNLTRVAALSPPIDLERCSALIAHPRNRIYELNFLRELLALCRQRQRFFPDIPEVKFPRSLTLRLFDDLYTAPRSGFADATDYYARASASPLLSQIEVPTLILTARDDPFIAVEPFEELQAPAHLEVRVVPQGGHLGFLGWDGAGGIRWAEQRLLEWLMPKE